jgi:hypothetical protein
MPRKNQNQTQTETQAQNIQATHEDLQKKIADLERQLELEKRNKKAEELKIQSAKEGKKEIPEQKTILKVFFISIIFS